MIRLEYAIAGGPGRLLHHGVTSNPFRLIKKFIVAVGQYGSDTTVVVKTV